MHLPPGKSLRTLGPSAADAARAYCFGGVYSHNHSTALGSQPPWRLGADQQALPYASLTVDCCYG